MRCLSHCKTKLAYSYSNIATTLRLLNLELNTNAYTRVNIFRNLHITILFRRIDTITNNISSYDSTLIKEGYTNLGSASDPNPYSSVTRLTGLTGRAKENKHIYLLISPPNAATGAYFNSYVLTG